MYDVILKRKNHVKNIYIYYLSEFKKKKIIINIK